MKQRIILSSVMLLLLTNSIYAQTKSNKRATSLIQNKELEPITKKVVVNIYNMESIDKVLRRRGDDLIILLSSKIDIDSNQKKRILEANYFTERSFFLKLRSKNYTIENILLKEHIIVKRNRSAYMKQLLKAKQFDKYLQLQASIEKKDLELKKLNSSDNSPQNAGRIDAVGWDLLLEDIQIVEK